MTPDVRNILEISLDNTFGLIVDFFHTFLFNTHYAITHLYSNTKILALQLLNNNQLVVNFYFQIILNDFIFNNKLYIACRYLLDVKSKFINNI